MAYSATSKLKTTSGAAENKVRSNQSGSAYFSVNV
ncbi:hypothetical protein GBF38_014258, partial [Nibea albiflora]